jgi:hypothetical protein
VVATFTARATTVIAPSFEELVANSELIFRGRVTAMRSISRHGDAKTAISTEVTFAIERTLRGSAGETITLEFLGGEIGGKRLHLAGWPRFAVGDRGIFFVEDRSGQVCPLMRLGHGRYRIAGDANTGTEHILREDFTALRTVQGVSLPMAEVNASRPPSVAAAALSVSAFESLVVERSAVLALPARRQ